MKNSTANKIKAKLAFHDVSDADAQQQFLVVLNGMKNNPAFPNPPVDMATYEKGVDSFGTLLTDAQDGGKKAISAKDKQRVAVIKMYTDLGHYVESACNDDPAIFKYQWFSAVVRTKTAPAPLAGSSFQWIDRGPNSGEIAVKIAALTGAIAYELRYTLVANGVASGSPTTLTLTSPRKLILTGLAPAGTYQFQVRALGEQAVAQLEESEEFGNVVTKATGCRATSGFLGRNTFYRPESPSTDNFDIRTRPESKSC